MDYRSLVNTEQYRSQCCGCESPLVVLRARPLFSCSCSQANRDFAMLLVGEAVLLTWVKVKLVHIRVDNDNDNITEVPVSMLVSVIYHR